MSVVKKFTPNFIYSPTSRFFECSPYVANNKLTNLASSGCRVWQDLTDSSYIVTFNSATTGSGISSGYSYFANQITFNWSDYFYSDEPDWSSGSNFFLYFPATFDSSLRILEVDVCNLQHKVFNSSDISTSNYSNLAGSSIVEIHTFCSLDISDSDSSGGSINFDDSNIVSSILFIPATLIVLSFFAVIYKIFINRRTRG